MPTLREKVQEHAIKSTAALHTIKRDEKTILIIASFFKVAIKIPHQKKNNFQQDRSQVGCFLITSVIIQDFHDIL